ncbi:MAG: hypothetical protein A3G27_05920 [Betaproteobacteria bacterium RIFCSPLOWO2_12_FULL_66_14]|nr:MAG: hypothetical protein A3G27_05920 [Betaproteobacteria bacterium RIFCSPLOWO2_12_FULL_66_14]
MIASPCTKVCVMDAGTRYCRGCARTIGEIARWGEMSDAERNAVLAQLPARRSEVAAVSVPPLA